MTELVLGGIAGSIAGLFTNPLEVVKTRMQLQGELKSRGCYVRHYRNVFHAFYSIAKYDGIFALQKGLGAAITYQFVMNGIRLGSYQIFTNIGLTKNKNGVVSFYKSVLCGATSGVISAMVASPLYLVKTHLQAQSITDIAVGHQRHHKGMIDAMQTIFREHGIKGLWRGVTASMLRVTVGSSIQLTTFAKSKEIIYRFQISEKDSWTNALAASSLSGIVVVCVMTPFDVVSTRLYNQPTDMHGVGKMYSGVYDCFKQIVKTENIFGLWKGFTASFVRLAPHTVLSLFVWNESQKFYNEKFSGELKA